MLKSFSFKNYRAFRSGKYPIRPITIFIGQNSIGKTSALQIPLLLKQTAQVTGTKYLSALKVQGRDLSYGEPLKLFHKLDFSEPVTIGVEFENSYAQSTLKESLIRRFIISMERVAQHISLLSRNLSKEDKKNDKLFKSIAKFVDLDPKALIEQDDDFFDQLVDARDRLSQFDKDQTLPLVQFRTLTRSIARRRMSGIKVSSLSKADLSRTLSFIKKISAISGNTFQVEYDVGLHENEKNKFLRVSRFSIASPKSANSDILTINFRDSDVDTISSDYGSASDINSYNKTLSKLLNPNSDIFSIAEGQPSEEMQYFFPDMIRELCSEFTNIVEEYFEEDAVGHIGPLRAHPKRFYLLDTAQAGSSEGDLLVEALRENDALRARINGWLQKFQININVNQFAEIIYRLTVRSGKNAFDLDITDVGFGISQILPILAEGFLSQEDRLIVVEQPEIHLHPKMQADLADLFIDMAGIRKNDKGHTKYFLIETHSEYLLNRIRRRLADGTISHEDVGLVYVESSDEGGASIRSVHVPTDGSFEWPKGFREATLDDAIAYAMAQKRSNS